MADQRSEVKQQLSNETIQNPPAGNLPPSAHKPDKKIIIGGIVIIVLALAAIGGGAYYFSKKQNHFINSCPTAPKTCADGTQINLAQPNCNEVCPEDKKAEGNETASWQTYRNEKYGFEIKYPNTLTPNEETTKFGSVSGDSIKLFEQNKLNGIIIEIFSIQPEEAAKDAFRRIYGMNPDDNSAILKSTKNIAGIETEYYQNIPGLSSYDQVFFIKNGYFYGFTKYISEENFDQILSTFKFIPSASPGPVEPAAEKSCSVDADCACGVKIGTEECFFGNKNYVDTKTQCPDFCTGIDGKIITKCVDNSCVQVHQ